MPTQLTILITLFVCLGSLLAGKELTEAGLLDHFGKSSYKVFDNSIVLECNITNIDEVLNKPYWERK